MTDAHCWEDVIGPDERRIAQEYEGERRLGSRPALLLIDCYRKVFGDRRRALDEAIADNPSTCGVAAWDALPHLERLLAGARAASLPVIHTTGEWRPAARLGATTRRTRRPGEDDESGYAFMPPLEPVAGELVVRKSRASAFFGTPLSTSLRLLGVDTVLVAGETTSGCVRATVVDAYSHGLHVGVVEEATFDRSLLAHKMNLFDIHLKYGTVMHVREALGHLVNGPAVSTA